MNVFINLVALTFLVLSTFAAPTSPHTQRETLQEAAQNARRLLHQVTTGTMSSIFPPGSSNGNDGRPFALMDVNAPCHPASSLTFISFPITLTAHNINSDPMHYATYTIQMPVIRGVSEFSRARVAFIGNLTILHDISAEENTRLSTCFTSYHPDSKWWLPNDREGAHTSNWGRFDIHDIYYVGGFGSTHYAGHIPLDLFTSIDVPEQSVSQWIST